MKTILLIDDDEVIRTSLKNALTNVDVEIIEAIDGEEGLAKAKELKPDLIVLDENMPKMNGQQVLEGIRNDHDINETEVIAFTVDEDILAMNKKLQAGVTEYLDKSSISPDQVADIIRLHLTK